jgi:hypothetical protein
VETVELRELATHFRQVGQVLAAARAHQPARQPRQKPCPHGIVTTFAMGGKVTFMCPCMFH